MTGVGYRLGRPVKTDPFSAHMLIMARTAPHRHCSTMPSRMRWCRQGSLAATVALLSSHAKVAALLSLVWRRLRLKQEPYSLVCTLRMLGSCAIRGLSFLFVTACARRPPPPPRHAASRSCLVLGNGDDDVDYVQSAGLALADAGDCDFVIARGSFALTGATTQVTLPSQFLWCAC
jgi:hypothetical protein